MGGELDQLVRESNDHLPVIGILPQLSDSEVREWVALGDEGRQRLRSGDEEGAESAFRGQLAIFPGNPEPWVSLALLDAERGKKKAALDGLRQAVLRGFRDLRQIQRAEAWSGMGSSPGWLTLVDALPHLVERERDWAAWDDLTASRPPEDLDALSLRHSLLVHEIDRMSPALGPHLTRLWKGALDRALAAELEAYVEHCPVAEDLPDALERLLGVYAGGPLESWERPAKQTVTRLSSVAALLLNRFPEHPRRPEALVALALTWSASRNRAGELRSEAIPIIRESLGEVLDEHRDSSVLSTALAGLVETEVELGERARAEEAYLGFREIHADDPALLARARQDLGELALEIGGLPEFQARTLDGTTVDPGSLRDKVVVLDFWATWCRPCVEEFPTLRKIDRRHGEDVVLLGVNMDDGDALSAEALRAWLDERDVPGLQLRDGRSWESRLVAAFGVQEIPFNVVVAPGGDVVAVNAHGKQLEKAVRQAMRPR